MITETELIAIAKAIRNSRLPTGYCRDVSLRIANVISDLHPVFNRRRFLMISNDRLPAGHPNKDGNNPARNWKNEQLLRESHEEYLVWCEMKERNHHLMEDYRKELRND